MKVVKEFLINGRQVKTDDDLKNCFINPADKQTLARTGYVKLEKEDQEAIDDMNNTRQGAPASDKKKSEK
jgi:hypothetical protein